MDEAITNMSSVEFKDLMLESSELLDRRLVIPPSPEDEDRWLDSIPTVPVRDNIHWPSHEEQGNLTDVLWVALYLSINPHMIPVAEQYVQPPEPERPVSKEEPQKPKKKRRPKRRVPDEEKDERYWIRRERNNKCARESRKRKRLEKLGL